MSVAKKEPDVLWSLSCRTEAALLCEWINDWEIPLQCHFDNKSGHLSVGSSGGCACLLEIELLA